MLNSHLERTVSVHWTALPVADPGFSFWGGGGANPKVGVFSGRSRIFLSRGHQLIFQIFCRKLHENVPLDPPMLSKDQKILHMEILRSVRSFVG